jgi:hypothetical protein
MLQQRHNLAALRGHDVAGAPLCIANDGYRDTVPASVASAPADGRRGNGSPKAFESHTADRGEGVAQCARGRAASRKLRMVSPGLDWLSRRVRVGLVFSRRCSDDREHDV